MSKPDKKAANQKPGKIVLLPVEQIEPSPFQARTAFDETEIAALAVSILQNGLLRWGCWKIYSAPNWMPLMRQGASGR